MKLYNPFKPHLVQFSNGTYAIRRWSFDHWKFLNLSGTDWLSAEGNVQQYCEMPYGQAVKLLQTARVFDKGRPVDAHINIRVGYTLLCILCFGAWTAIAVCIAWPIINWMANGFGG